MNRKPIRAKENFLVFGQPQINEIEIQDVVETLRSGWIGTGPKVQQFEKQFSIYKKVNGAVALNSCTSATHLSLLISKIQKGDEIITTPMTFCSTINSIIHAGGTPVLADIEPDTWNISPTEIEKKITPKTKAIVIVHFAGRSCNMSSIMKLVTKHNLILIEDCAHAIETIYHDRPAGTFGDFGVFSFYSTKNLVTGEGGMLISKTKKSLEKAKVLGLHGMNKDAWKRYGDEGFKHYDVTECGFKYNMMDMQAVLGIQQLRRIEQNWIKRQKVWDYYMDALSELPIKLPSKIEPKTKHAFHLFQILVDEKQVKISRNKFIDKMTENNIGVGVHYLSVPEHTFYKKKYGWNPADFPVAKNIGRQIVSLPISPKLTENDIRDVVNAVHQSINL